MNHAKYIGRVGGLAVALGVGLAVASAPGIAAAETADSSRDSSNTSQAGDSGGAASSGAAGATSSDRPDDATTQEESATSDDEEGSDGDFDADEGSGADEDSDPGADLSDDLADDLAGEVEAADDGAAGVGEDTESEELRGTEDAVGDVVATSSNATDAPNMPVSLVADVAIEQPAPQPAPEAPAPAVLPMALATLAGAREESERAALRSSAVAPPEIELLADTSPNVLVIGVDGTNLSRVLADLANTNFFGLIQDGTTAPASIAGHTTISNPSWTSILTGAWGEKTGVINNVFTPWTYDDWPTVFTQLEAFNSAIQTTSIANWNVISAIAGAGTTPADEIIDIGQIEGDTDWLLTDDAVGDATELAIMAADPMIPNFVFSYFVGVDENGHMYGGASPQYAAAIRNVDRNLGEILQAVDAWEALTGEQWTILVVTDHGHQPQQGFGHGFQSPDETSTFVIAENPNLFAAGAINLKYQIVDVTPTVMTLFGGTPSTDSDGVSLTTLGSSDVFPVNDDEALRGALQDAIAMYGYPDIGTNIALGVRTIAATVPYIVYGLTESLTAGLQQIVDQEIFLISPLAALAIVPVRLIGNLTYVVTNVVAQIVARLTGVTGASIFPLWPPAPPSVESPLDTAQLCEGDSDAALPACGQIAV
ncbi:alkaline phosphatase family protein [uncultured Mycolicibacterium sp.]|uniref:alkaline phosphatase family protein n=1 Tax=uncultured Mycolicibacterium sp. TaxID=2320817 RepID=UPI0032B276C6